MRVSANFTGLVGLTTASHVHCCVAQPANAGVATTTPTFVGTPLGVSSGAWDQTYNMTLASTWNAAFVRANGGTPAGAEAAFMTGVAPGQSYLNIHSTTFGGGEIRGQLVLHRFATNTNLSDRAKGTAAGLDSLGAGTGALSNLLVTTAFLTPTLQAAMAEVLAPVASHATRLVVSDSLNTSFNQVGGRLSALRAEGPGNGAWLIGHGAEGTQKFSAGYEGYKNSGWGFAGGWDQGLDADTFVGVAVSYTDSSIDYRDQADGNSTDVTSTQVSIYGTRNLGQFYVDGMIAYGWQKYDSVRDDLGFGEISGDSDGSQWGVRLGAGMPYEFSPSVTITPQARLDWDSLKQDGYTETGGGPLAFSYESQSADRLRTSLGAQLDFTFGMGVTPFVRGFWHHELENKGLDLDTTFVAGGASFTTPGQKLDSDPFSVGAGLNFIGDGAFSAAVSYDLTVGKSYESHAFQAKLRFAF